MTGHARELQYTKEAEVRFTFGLELSGEIPHDSRAYKDRPARTQERNDAERALRASTGPIPRTIGGTVDEFKATAYVVLAQ